MMLQLALQMSLQQVNFTTATTKLEKCSYYSRQEIYLVGSLLSKSSLSLTTAQPPASTPAPSAEVSATSSAVDEAVASACDPPGEANTAGVAHPPATVESGEVGEGGEAVGEAGAPAGGDSSPKKKKKRKDTYAAMMASVMAPTMTEAEKKAEAEKKLRSSMGGGQFSKLDKI